ncbi:hypothetical protein ACWDKQ_22310 [Saccharopolyspora sp. NPDC000995]
MLAELLDLPPHPDDLFVEVEVFQCETEQFALTQAARCPKDGQRLKRSACPPKSPPIVPSSHTSTFSPPADGRWITEDFTGSS